MLEKICDYLDTSNTSINRIKKARKHINQVLFSTIIAFFIAYTLSFVFDLIGENFTSILSMCVGIILFVLSVALVIKREIYSLAILFKEKK